LSKLIELYLDFLTAVKPRLIVTHRRVRGRGRSRSRIVTKTLSNCDEDEQQEQDEQQQQQQQQEETSDSQTKNEDEKMADGSPPDALKPIRDARASSRASVCGQSELTESGGDELLEDDDLVFVLNELGQAYAAQGQYHTAEAYYRHALRISESHFALLPDLSSPSISPPISSSSSSCSASEIDALPPAAAIPNPSAPSTLPQPFFSTPSPRGRATGVQPQLGLEYEDKCWQRNLATTLHNLGKLCGEQCSYSAAIEHVQRALELRQSVCGHVAKADTGITDPVDGRRRQETEGKRKMRRGMEDREMVGESMLALGAAYTQLGTHGPPSP